MSSSMATAAIILAGLVAGVGETQTPAQPIRLDVVENGDRVVLTVIGASNVPVNARFKLSVSSEGRGGTNRTSQSGAARLRPGKQVTMTTLSVSTEKMGKWHATLDVERDGAHAYSLERGSSS